ncbi:hypothetical protein FB567DRAFT_542952 [Paraphoma chrysanthemicola]|uniref:J domain-containing protein n=1 Tax=Paraphoma chrysanthemicola TaxID=798071 RepID=A0A8K0RFS3_9PLEO|nr:hypothetical protein FB567DRAFT_542952 [Paraphoma chrysanthemicola]
MLDINAAYRRILLANHPDNTQDYAPFRKIQCDKLIREANAAWEALSNPISKASYDRKLPPVGPFSQYPSSASSFAAGRPPDGKHWQPSASGIPTDDSDQNANPPAEEGTAQKAEYRTMQTSDGTIIDIKISTWRFDILISNKLRFTNTVTELSNPSINTSSVSFEVVLERDKSSSEALGQTVNELTFKVHEIPNDLHRTIPWELGFDFDMNNQFATIKRQRATCMMLSVDEPVVEVQSGRGEGTPENVLREDAQFSADEWCMLGGNRLGKAVYGDGGMEMWRMVAVGFKKGAKLGAFD